VLDCIMCCLGGVKLGAEAAQAAGSLAANAPPTNTSSSESGISSKYLTTYIVDARGRLENANRKGYYASSHKRGGWLRSIANFFRVHCRGKRYISAEARQAAQKFVQGTKITFFDSKTADVLMPYEVTTPDGLKYTAAYTRGSISDKTLLPTGRVDLELRGQKLKHVYTEHQVDLDNSKGRIGCGSKPESANRRLQDDREAIVFNMNPR